MKLIQSAFLGIAVLPLIYGAAIPAAVPKAMAKAEAQVGDPAYGKFTYF